MSADFVLYLTQFGAATLYAFVLEVALKRRYEPDYTWVTVVWGTAQVGILIAFRLILAPLPALTGADLAWYVWWLWTYSYVASGLPIIIWQVVIQTRRWRLVQRAWERWHGGVS